MTRNEQKAEELRHVEAFLRCFAGPPVGLRLEGESEAPDFLLGVAGGKRVGLEVVSLDDRVIHQTDAALDRLARDVEDRLSGAMLKAILQIKISQYAGNLKVDAPWCRRNAKIISDLVLSELPLREAKVRFSKEQLRAAGAELVEWVCLSRGDDLDGLVMWNVNVVTGKHAWFVQERVREKDEKCKRYRRLRPELDEQWLLLVAGRNFASGVLESVLLDGAPFASEFDALFYVDHASGNAGRLECTLPEKLRSEGEPSPSEGGGSTIGGAGGGST